MYFNAGGHSFGTGSDVGFGTTDSMSVVACATYSVKRRLSLAPVNRQWEVRSPPGLGRLRMRTKEVMQFG